jgi:hypothetical protein
VDAVALVLEDEQLVGDGGYGVLPPSRRPDGLYVWEASSRIAEVPLAPLPDAWLRRLIALGSNARKVAEEIPGVIPTGARNETRLSLAGSMRRCGASRAAILAALQIENATRCVPPLDPKEVEAIAANAARYEPRTHTRTQPRNGPTPPAPAAEELPPRPLPAWRKEPGRPLPPWQKEPGRSLVEVLAAKEEQR